ncbi:MAG: hypothetical protein JRI62_04425 [Deltaproteobacteria bacterium]|nr:hypothetical protein [Deltaproteobacteria bacterium]
MGSEIRLLRWMLFPDKQGFLPLMRIVELSIAVADSHEAVLEKACMVTSANGGAGAVREVCEAILKTQGLWDKIPLVAEWLM